MKAKTQSRTKHNFPRALAQNKEATLKFSLKLWQLQHFRQKVDKICNLLASRQRQLLSQTIEPIVSISCSPLFATFLGFLWCYSDFV